MNGLDQFQITRPPITAHKANSTANHQQLEKIEEKTQNQLEHNKTCQQTFKKNSNEEVKIFRQENLEFQDLVHNLQPTNQLNQEFSYYDQNEINYLDRKQTQSCCSDFSFLKYSSLKKNILLNSISPIQNNFSNSNYQNDPQQNQDDDQNQDVCILQNAAFPYEFNFEQHEEYDKYHKLNAICLPEIEDQSFPQIQTFQINIYSNIRNQKFVLKSKFQQTQFFYQVIKEFNFEKKFNTI
ncbi:hypothetical protein ABPG72_019078 [Tetrahymena utriculariae]